MQYILTITLYVEPTVKFKSGIVNENGMFIEDVPIGHGAVNVAKVIGLAMLSAMYVITNSQLIVVGLKGGVGVLSTTFPLY